MKIKPHNDFQSDALNEHPPLSENKSNAAPDAFSSKGSDPDTDQPNTFFHQLPHMLYLQPFTENEQRFIKMAIFVLIATLFIISRSFYLPTHVSCLSDRVLEFLHSTSVYIQETEHRRNFVQVSCSALMDLIAFGTLGYWLAYGKSSRLLAAVGVFYLARTLLQKVFFMPFPELFYWDEPNFPSVSVPYGRASDFFFSGHSGFLVLTLSEWKKWGHKKIVYAIYGALLYTIFTLFVFRVHYVIDVFTGLFYADWAFKLVDKYSDQIDATLIYIGKKLIIFRSLFFSKLFFIAFTALCTKGVSDALPNYDPPCVEDAVMNFFLPFTQYVHGQAMLRSSMQVIFSGLMDIVFVGTFAYWVKNTKSSALPISIGAFYAVRVAIRYLFDTSAPELSYWESPGFPSLVVTYGVPSTFFFSDYVGLLMLCANEWKRLGYKKVNYGIYALIAYIGIALMVFRINYSIDIFTGVFFADWLYDIVAKHSEDIDTILVYFGSVLKLFWKTNFFKSLPAMNHATNHVSNDGSS